MGLLISLYLNRSIGQVSNVKIIKIKHSYFVVNKSVTKYVIKNKCQPYVRTLKKKNKTDLSYMRPDKLAHQQEVGLLLWARSNIATARPQ